MRVDNIKLTRKVDKVGVGTCGLCGSEEELLDIFGKTFTNLDELNGQYVCKECAKLFENEWRKTGFKVVKNKISKLRQKHYAELMFHRELELPAAISFSESRQKHRLFRTRISYSFENIYLSVDDGEYVFDCTEDSWEVRAYNFLERMYNEYKISKSQLLEGFKSYKLREIDMGDYFKFARLHSQYGNRYKYKLIVDFINKWTQKETKKKDKKRTKKKSKASQKNIRKQRIF